MKVRNEICEQCISLLHNILMKQRGVILLPKISESSRLKEDLQMDSLLLIMLQVELEDTFQFRFDYYEDDFEEIFQSVRTICDYIERHLKGELTP